MRTAERLRYLVLAAQRDGNRWLAAQLRPLHLTPSQAEVLRVLGDYGPLSLTGLGQLLICESGTNPSRLVDRLVGAGLVDRSAADASDRRQIRVDLTATGRTLQTAVKRVEEQMYANIDNIVTEQECTAVLDVLTRLVADQPAGAAVANRLVAERR